VIDMSKQIFQNFDQLAITPLRKQALLIAEQGFLSVEPERAVEKEVHYNPKTTVLKIEGKTFTLKDYKKVTCIGVGKAAFRTVAALQKKLGKLLTCGFVLDLQVGTLDNVVCRVGTHPYPTEVNGCYTRNISTD
jgi:glycerate-2-kinase